MHTITFWELEWDAVTFRGYLSLGAYGAILFTMIRLSDCIFQYISVIVLYYIIYIHVYIIHSYQ